MLAACLPFTEAAVAQEKDILKLKVGDRELREKTLDVEQGKIYSLKTGEEVTFDQMVAAMKKARFVYVGESHDSQAMHDIQARIAEAMHEQDHNLAIGLEMFPVTNQEILNKWSAGILTEEEFVDQAPWYETVSYTHLTLPTN